MTEIIQRIKKFLQVHSRAKESETPRNGVLSYAGEFHSLAIGAAIGVYAAIQNQPELVAAMIAVTLGLGASSSAMRRLKKALKKSGAGGFKNALGEVRREPWYTMAGLAIGYTVGQWNITAMYQVVEAVQTLL